MPDRMKTSLGRLHDHIYFIFRVYPEWFEGYTLHELFKVCLKERWGHLLHTQRKSYLTQYSFCQAFRNQLCDHEDLGYDEFFLRNLGSP